MCSNIAHWRIMVETIGSLCSGYGGLDMGLQLALGGGQVLWHAEYDRDASKILAHHWPDVPNLSDITKTDWPTVPRVDWITAGYPCQPFSNAGKRKGTADERHLWPYVASAVRLVRPRRVLLENVRGHLSLGFGRVLADLAGLGYVGSWVLLRAADVGAPHGRARVFVVATDASGERHGGGQDAGGLGCLDGEDAGRPRQRERAREVTGDRSGATVEWGPYEPAIRRWERLTRPAPPPTEPGPKGEPQIAPKFEEWMMGLPAGHVTGVPGLSYRAQLKALGNGVVPQQAAAAVFHLLS